jgi:hypothetical protein
MNMTLKELGALERLVRAFLNSCSSREGLKVPFRPTPDMSGPLFAAMGLICYTSL